MKVRRDRVFTPGELETISAFSGVDAKKVQSIAWLAVQKVRGQGAGLSDHPGPRTARATSEAKDMNIIVKNRQQGKTADLVKMASERGGYIVCHTEQEAHRVFRDAYDQDIHIAHPITFDEFLNHRYGPGVKEFYIDNVEVLLARLSRVPIHAITLTGKRGAGRAEIEATIPSLYKLGVPWQDDSSGDAQ